MGQANAVGPTSIEGIFFWLVAERDNTLVLVFVLLTADMEWQFAYPCLRILLVVFCYITDDSAQQALHS